VVTAVSMEPLGTWTNLNPTGTVPHVLQSAEMAYDPTSGKGIMFGGLESDNNVDESLTWSFDLATKTWAQLHPSTAPSARDGGPLVYDPADAKIVLFGGTAVISAGGDRKAYNDTWAYDPAKNTWTDLKPSGTAPSPRSDPAFVYDSKDAKYLLFGGWNGTEDNNETWSYDPKANTWTQLNPTGSVPSARSRTASVYDPSSGKLYMFGGFAKATGDYLDEMWTYDPTANTWTQIQPKGTVPEVRNAACLVIDASGKFLMFGGANEDYGFNDTWFYDPAGNTWTMLNQTDIHALGGKLPQWRSSAAYYYDAKAGALVVFGGYNGNQFVGYNDIWSYAPPK